MKALYTLVVLNLLLFNNFELNLNHTEKFSSRSWHCTIGFTAASFLFLAKKGKSRNLKPDGPQVERWGVGGVVGIYCWNSCLWSEPASSSFSSHSLSASFFNLTPNLVYMNLQIKHLFRNIDLSSQFSRYFLFFPTL